MELLLTALATDEQQRRFGGVVIGHKLGLERTKSWNAIFIPPRRRLANPLEDIAEIPEH